MFVSELKNDNNKFTISTKSHKMPGKICPKFEFYVFTAGFYSVLFLVPPHQTQTKYGYT